LRSIIWGITGNLSTATYWATRVGRGFAYLLILLGALALFAGAGFQGVWLAVIGLFLLQGAQAGYMHVLFKEALAGVAVRNIMVQDVVTVPPDLSVLEAIERYFLVYGYGGFPVVEHGRILGVVSLAELKQVPAEERQRRSVREVMTPLEARLTLAPDEDMAVALQRMTQEGLGRMVVMERDRMVGLLTKTGLSRFLQTRLELRA
jgi:CBS domain-containing protein